MIVQLTGTLADMSPNHVVLDVGGVGYELGVSAYTATQLPSLGTPGISLFTRMVVRENAMLLYGFVTQEERALFDKLCSVSGVGPSVALSVLSTLSPEALAGAVINADATAISAAPGVGKKLANRLLVELEGAFASDAQLKSVIADTSVSSSSGSSSVEADVSAALLSMGFTSQEVALVLDAMPQEELASPERAIAFALRRLGGAA